MGDLPEEIVEDITKNQPAYDSRVKALFLTDDEFERMASPSFDLEGYRLTKNNMFIDAYRTIQDILKSYVDMNEDYYPLVALWIIGTYFHKAFQTYPYLYFNAMKGSGKTRLLGLIAYLSYKGKLVVNMSESVLFRTAKDSTICIDEFERTKGKEKANLRELLNASYKKGIVVERAKKVKKLKSEEFEIEKFEVFCPVAMANISGMDEVLGDRSIKLTLERTSNISISRKLEIWNLDSAINLLKDKLVHSSAVYSSQSDIYTDLYTEWNNQLYTIHTLHQTTLNNTIIHKISNSSLNGRHLELFFPLFILAEKCGDMDRVLEIAEKIIKEKKEEDVYENRDISLIDFISGKESYGEWIPLKHLLNEFKEFLQSEDEWINGQWLGIALSRLSLVKEKRRLGKGVEIILNIEKAQEKIKMFK